MNIRPPRTLASPYRPWTGRSSATAWSRVARDHAADGVERADFGLGDRCARQVGVAGLEDALCPVSGKGHRRSRALSSQI